MAEPVIETERLLLRPPRREDLDGWAELMADPENSRFIGGPVARAGAWRGMAAMAGSWALYGFGMFSLIEKASGRWVGRVGPWQPEEWPGTEVGWGIVKPAWGRGYATEAAVATISAGRRSSTASTPTTRPRFAWPNGWEPRNAARASCRHRSTAIMWTFGARRSRSGGAAKIDNQKIKFFKLLRSFSTLTAALRHLWLT